jgi:dipeptidyl aminopeptidase/acylaminoacyl peptidase
MSPRHRTALGSAAAFLLVLGPHILAAQVITLEPRLGLRPAELRHKPTIAQFLSPGYPEDLASARHADRIAWNGFESGRRNVYTAAAPDFKARRLTSFPRDEGDVLSDVELSDDGSIVVFVHGGAPNHNGWVPNPNAKPAGTERAIWAVRSIGGAPWRVAEGGNPELSPNGRWVLFVRDSQIYRAAVTRTPRTSEMDKGEKPFIKEWGAQSSPRWSPDGTRIAFVTTRTDHSFIAVYDVKTSKVTYLAPSVDFDASPSWSADGKRIAFIRRPGVPFGQQAQPGLGSIGNPAGPAFGRTGGPGGGGGRFGAGGRRGAAGADDSAQAAARPGLFRAAFEDGSTLSFWIGDAATGEAHEIWHNQPEDKRFPTTQLIVWADDAVIFPGEPDEWAHWYSVPVSGGDPAAAPVDITPGDGQVEFTALSSDRKTLFYTSNAGDIERRHVWKAPTSGGQAEQVTTGDGIETYPAALASGKMVATLSSDALRPFGVGVWPAAAGAPKSAQRVIYPTLTRDFPTDALVAPVNVTLKAEDGVEFHNQLFLPKDLKPGEKRPAIIFVHGGPVRQMLLGDHYMWFYHTAYQTNQWLQSMGYVVMSVNYRSGIGYGKSFRLAADRGGQGNSEYRDVIAAGRYLETRDDVDPKRVGIWGLSYGGVLTAQALARNSDVFVTGVDLAGVHLWGSSLDTADVSYKSSAISAIDGWKSPVLVIQGDDDRNVAFSQTVGLVQLLRAHKVYHELIVFPDDTHESLLDSRWMYIYARMEEWLDKYLKNAGNVAVGGQERH